MQESRLAGTRGADDRHHLPRLEDEIDTAQDLETPAAVDEMLVQAADLHMSSDSRAHWRDPAIRQAIHLTTEMRLDPFNMSVFVGHSRRKRVRDLTRVMQGCQRIDPLALYPVAYMLAR